jgi:outer membrane protein TolC
MKRLARAVVTAALVAVLPAQAQERALTLGEVLDLAAQHNPTYRQALNNLELSSAERRASLGAFLPGLRLNVGTSFSANRQLTAFDNFGNPIENPITEWRKSSSTSQTASLDLDLFNGLTRFHDITRNNAQADARASAAEASLASVEATLRRDFLTTLRQRALLEIEEEAYAGRQRDFENTQELFRLADVGMVQVRAAELEVIRQERAIADAQSEYQKALLALRAAVGDPTLRSFDVIGDVPEAFDPSTLDLERLVSRGLESNPTVLERDAGITAGRAALKAAKGSRWPSLTFGLDLNQRVNGNETSAFLDPYPDASRWAGLSFNLSIPVFTQFETSRQIAQADVELRNAEQSMREMELQVERDARTQILELQKAWDNYRINVRARDLADERLTIAREEFRLAGVTFDELRTAINDALAERRGVINAHFDFLNALVNLEETIGGAVTEGAGGR